MYSYLQAFFRGANTSLQVFMLLNLNPVMSIIANVPAAIASTVRIPLIFVYSIHGPYMTIPNRLLLAGSSGV
jgi:hypothetical protein